MPIDPKRDKQLFENEWLSIYERDGWYIIADESRCQDGQLIGLLIFTRDIAGNIDKVLGRYEYDHVTGEKGTTLTSVTGGVDHGSTPIESALEEMAQEAGYYLTEEDLVPLGTFEPSKAMTTVMHLYGFDATGMEDMRREEAEGDGTEGEDGAFCEWVEMVPDIINMNSPVNHVALLRLSQHDIDNKL